MPSRLANVEKKSRFLLVRSSSQLPAGSSASERNAERKLCGGQNEERSDLKTDLKCASVGLILENVKKKKEKRTHKCLCSDLGMRVMSHNISARFPFAIIKYSSEQTLH